VKLLGWKQVIVYTQAQNTLKVVNEDLEVSEKKAVAPKKIDVLENESFLVNRS
jgi:hypothetical protein